MCEVSVDELQNSEKKPFKERGQVNLFKGLRFLDPYKLGDELATSRHIYGLSKSKETRSIAAFRHCTKHLLKGLRGFVEVSPSIWSGILHQPYLISLP